MTMEQMQKSVTFDSLPTATAELIEMVGRLLAKVEMLEISQNGLRKVIAQLLPNEDTRPTIVENGKIFGYWRRDDVFYLTELKDEKSLLLRKNNPNSPIESLNFMRNWYERKGCPHHGTKGGRVYFIMGEIWDWLYGETQGGDEMLQSIKRKGFKI